MLTMLLCAAFACHALFVSPNGSDQTGDGSQQSPYASLHKASDEANPGDTIYVRGNAGPFTSIQTISCNGTGNDWIVVKPYQDEQPVIDPGIDPRADCETPDWPIPNILSIKEASYVIVEGIEARNFCGRAMQILWCEHIVVRNCLFHDVFEGGVNMSGEHIVFEHNEIHHACLKNEDGAIEAGWAWPATSSTHPSGRDRDSRHITYRHNYVHDSWGEGFIALRADSVIIEHNTFANLWAIMTYMDYAVNVTIRHNHYYADDPAFNRKQLLDWPAAAIAWSTEGGPTYPDYKTDRAIEHVEITNNIIAGAGRGLQFFYYGSNSIENQTYRDFLIAHNVFVDIAGDRAIETSEVPADKPQPQDITFVNNIVGSGVRGNQALRTLKIGRPGEGDDIAGWEFSNNCWIDGIPEAGLHPGAIEGDPGFVGDDIGSPESFQLIADSRCIGAGAALEQVSIDFSCAPRVTEAPAIGAWTYGATRIYSRATAALGARRMRRTDALYTPLGRRTPRANAAAPGVFVQYTGQRGARRCLEIRPAGR
jgi:hypothetical protein